MDLNIPSAPYDPNSIFTISQQQNAVSNAALDTQVKGIQAKYAQPNAAAALQKQQLENAKNQMMFNFAKQALGNFGQSQPQGAQSNNNLNINPSPQGAAPNNSLAPAPNDPGRPMPTNPLANPGAPQGMPQTQPQGNGLPKPSQQPGGVASPNIPTNNNGMTYQQAAMVQPYMGQGNPSIQNINGTITAISPYGNYPLAQGLTAAQQGYQGGKGAGAAKAYNDYVSAYTAMKNQEVPLHQLIELTQNPEFDRTVGPVSAFFKNLTGTPEQKSLLGQLRSTSGEVELQVAPQLGATLTDSDKGLLNTIKANPDKDFKDVFRGKLQSQALIKSVLSDRAYRAANYIDQGMSQLEAAKKAVEETPLDKYKPQVDKLMYPNGVTIRNSKGERKTVSLEDARKIYKVNV